MAGSEVEKNRWINFSHERGAQKLENIQDEFFSNADIVSEVSALVRESIQNSLDELFDPNSPLNPQVAVKVIFTLGTQTPEMSKKYFSSVHPHAATVIKNDLPSLDLDSKFLIIEDFNTRGLEGSVDSLGYEDSDENKSKSDDKNPALIKHSFLDFEWTSGSSSKKANNRGSWGVGKIVFPRASGLRTYLVFSVRRRVAAPEGNTHLLFGHSILKYRWLDKTQFKPDSKWMINDPNLGPIPSSNMDEIAQFKRDWKITRGEELGTSIVIPFCQSSMSIDKLAQSIIRDYFITILSGNLVVEIRDDRHSSTLIDAQSLPNLIENLENEEGQPIISKNKAELQELCGVYLASLQDSGTVKFRIAQSSSDKVNDWASVEISSEEQDRMSHALSSGHVLEIVVETHVPKTSEVESAIDEFTILVRKFDAIKTNTVFYREGILIPDANRDSKIQDLISIVLAGNLTSSSALANLLKDSEGPSHSDWQHLRSKFKGKYQPQYAGMRTLSWVKGSVLAINRILRKRESMEDTNALSRYFPDPSVNNGIVTKPNEPSVKLNFKIIDLVNGVVELSWNTVNFESKKYEVHRLLPSSGIVRTGEGEESLSISDLSVGAIYQYRVVCYDEVKRVVSNLVTVDLNPPLPPSPSAPKLTFAMNMSGNGFAVTPNDKSLFNVGDILSLRAAYMTRGMDSFGAWAPYDFQMSEMLNSGTLRGVEVKCEGNRATLTVKAIDFYAEWVGFDSSLRSLVVEETTVPVNV